MPPPDIISNATHSGMKEVLFCVVCITIFPVVLVVVFFAAPSLHADIYMYVDKEGHYYFTDTPPSPEYRLFIRERRPRRKVTGASVQFDHHIREASRHYGVDFYLLKAIVKAESNFDPRAVSKRGAVGLMQIMPDNFKALNIRDPYDPYQNIMGGTYYIKKLLNRFRGNLQLALAAYNAGPNNVNPLRGVPRIRETEDYVQKVMTFYQSFKNKKHPSAHTSLQ